jgi:hypothetical protein
MNQVFLDGSTPGMLASKPLILVAPPNPDFFQEFLNVFLDITIGQNSRILVIMVVIRNYNHDSIIRNHNSMEFSNKSFSPSPTKAVAYRKSAAIWIFSQGLYTVDVRGGCVGRMLRLQLG